MSLKSVFIPALAFVGSVAAQCSTTATLTIQNQGDADRLSGCRTYSGSIAIATGTTGDIALTGVQRIAGSLNADNAVGLPSLSASSLETIDDTFSLTNMTLLTSLTFPRLASVGTISWTTLPRLSSLSFTNGVRRADTVRIFDSQLGSLDGINLETVGEMTISNNGQLNELEMQLSEITSTFNIEFNGRMTTVSLPNLETAFNMTFRNVSRVSMPSLAAINSSMGFYACNFETLSAPNLTTIGGDLSIVSNGQLTNVSMPQLESLDGALQLANNTELKDINGFPALATVGGAVDFYGNFSNAELPALSDVAGAFNLQSTENLDQTCARFNDKTGRDNVIKGEYTCVGSTSNPGGVGSSPTDGSTSTQSGSAARELFARSSAVTGVLGVFAALFGML